MAALSDVQLSASEAKKKKKKKRKKERLLREGLRGAEADSSSFVSSGRDDEPDEACEKKENGHREASDSQLDAPCDSMESEVMEMESEAGAGILTHRKKKKKKHAPAEPDDAELRVRVAQEKASEKEENGHREASDSQVDAPCVSMESEVMEMESEAGTGILTHRKKKKKKHAPAEPDDAELRVHVAQEKASEKEENGQREVSDSQLDAPCDSMESKVMEMESEAGAGVLTHRKKKKKKHAPAEPDDAELRVRVAQEKTSEKEENGHREASDSQLDAPCVKKKKKKHAPAEPDDAELRVRMAQEKTSEKEENGHREASDSQVDAPCISMESEVMEMESEAGAGVLAHRKKKRKKHAPIELDDAELHVRVAQEKTSEKEENGHREASDSQLDAPCVSMESEVMEMESEAGAGVLAHRKKKRKKHAPIEPDDAELRVRVAQEKTSTSPRTDTQEDVWHEGTPVRKKKREKALFTDRAEANAPSPGRQAQVEPSGLEDAPTELFTSLPLSQCPSFQGKKRKKRGGSNLDTSREPDSPLMEKKSHRKRKRSRAAESDTPDGLAAEEGVGLANRDSQRPRSSPKRGALEGNNGSAFSPTPVCDAEKELSPPPSVEGAQSVLENSFLDSSKVPQHGLDTAAQELEAFIPHARSLSASAIKQLAQQDLARFKHFQEEGVAVKFGRFSQKENEQLIANVEAFLETSGIETAEKLFFPDRFPEEKRAIRKLRTEHFFGVKIAEEIPRPWRLVYYRARKMYDPQNSNREYSAKEIKKLKKYYAMYGNNWKKISELMHRSSHSVALKYSLIKSKPNSGSWSKEEEKQLIRAVEETVRSKVRGSDSAAQEGDAEKALLLTREDLYKGISWTEVEAKVGTRHWRQCKHKWMSVVTRRMSRRKCSTRGPKSLQAKVNLIKRMYKLNVEDASEIDWEDLSSALGDVPPDYVQRRFSQLKVRHVPSWNARSFSEIIDHLYEVTLPEFKKQLRKYKKYQRCATLKPSQAGKSGQKKTYKFSDIFWISDEELSEDFSEDEDEGKENETSKPASEEVELGSQKDSGSL